MENVGTQSKKIESKEAAPYLFVHSIRTDVGQRRGENQDAYGAVETPLGMVFILADGMGGAQGGATASAIAVNMITRGAVSDSGKVSPQSMRSSIQKSNRKIYEASTEREDLAGMGTTVVGLALLNEIALFAHVGDSRLYHYFDGKLRQLTKDHTLVQELVDAGTLPAEKAENHPIGHMLTRALGQGLSVEIDEGRLDRPLKDGDKFLLCCDGLTNHVSDNEIERVLLESSVQDVADILVDMANERGGSDNITIEVVEVRENSNSELTQAALSGEHRLMLSTDLCINGDGEPIKDRVRFDDILLKDVVDSTEALEKSSEKTQASEAPLAETVNGKFDSGFAFSEDPKSPTECSSKDNEINEAEPQTAAILAARNAKKPQIIAFCLAAFLAIGTVYYLTNISGSTYPGPNIVENNNQASSSGAKSEWPFVNELKNVSTNKISKGILTLKDPPSAVIIGADGRELSAGEMEYIISAKDLLLDRIDVLSASIKVLEIPHAERSLEEARLVEQNFTAVEQAIGVAEHEINDTVKRYQSWLEKREMFNLKDIDLIKLADDIAIHVEKVREQRDIYKRASLRYLNAVQEWTDDSENTQKHAFMSEMSKKLNQEEKFLEEKVSTILDKQIDELLKQVADWGLTQRRFEQQKRILGHKASLLRSYQPMSATTRAEAIKDKKMLLADLQARLENLEKDLPEDIENTYRRKKALRELGVDLSFR